MNLKDCNELTLGDLGVLKEYIQKINQEGFNIGEIKAKDLGNPYSFLVGKPVFIRTVTMYYTGRLLEVHPGELVLGEAAWVADTGRFHDALATGNISEVEPFVAEKIILGRGAILDVCEWGFALPREQK